MKNIAAALVKAQKAFGPALKTKNNPHLRSKYADLQACTEAVTDALNSNGIFLMQPTHSCDDGVIVETLFIHESGEQISSGRLYIKAAKLDPQGLGGALTYARRYSLMAACGIAQEDDDGHADSQQKTPQKTFEKFPGSALEALLHDIEDCINVVELKDAYAKAIAAVGADAEAKKLIIDMKDKKKAAL